MSQFITKIFYKQRDDFARSCIERDRNLTLPDGITVKSDIPYINDGISAHRLDIYRPAGRDNDVLPVMINIHGGGLLLGSKEFNRCFCANIAALGYIVYSIEYRLIPDCNFLIRLMTLNVHLTISAQESNPITETVSIYMLPQTAAVPVFLHMQQPSTVHVTLQEPHMYVLPELSSMQSDL